MAAVGIKREPVQGGFTLQLRRSQQFFFSAQPHPQLAARVGPRPDQHHGGDHARVFFRVLVRFEKLAGAVHQQVVQVHVHGGQPQRLGDLLLQSSERPLTPHQAQPVGIDFAGVPHARIQQGLIAPAKRRGRGGFDQLFGRFRPQRLVHDTHVFDFHPAQLPGRQGALHRETPLRTRQAGRFGRFQQGQQFTVERRLRGQGLGRGEHGQIRRQV